MLHPPARRVPAGQGRGAGGHIEADGAGQLLADAGQQVFGQAVAPAGRATAREAVGGGGGGGGAAAPVGWFRSLGRPPASPAAHPGVLAHGTAEMFSAVFSSIAGLCSGRPFRASGVDNREGGPQTPPKRNNRAEKCTAGGRRRLLMQTRSCRISQVQRTNTSDTHVTRLRSVLNNLQRQMHADRCRMTNAAWRGSPPPPTAAALQYVTFLGRLWICGVASARRAFSGPAGKPVLRAPPLPACASLGCCGAAKQPQPPHNQTRPSSCPVVLSPSTHLVVVVDGVLKAHLLGPQLRPLLPLLLHNRRAGCALLQQKQRRHSGSGCWADDAQPASDASGHHECRAKHPNAQPDSPAGAPRGGGIAPAPWLLAPRRGCLPGVAAAQGKGERNAGPAVGPVRQQGGVELGCGT